MDFLLSIILGAVAIWALVKVSKLSERVRLIEGRFLMLERHIAGSAPIATAAPGAAPPPSEPTPAEIREQIEQVPEQFREQPATAAAPETAHAEPEAVPLGSPPPQPPPPGTPPSPPGHMPGLEERFGTRWVVWVGGLALALGGIFLVKYTIDQGLIGPGVRMVLATLFAVALIAAGEWLRRQEKASGVAGLPSAHIPGILTAAGTTVGYATVWAAYELWGFLSPGAAFILLGVVALATLAAALLHGPALGGLGLVGAYIAPILVSTKVPNYWALYVYLAVVTAAAFALARMRLWRWLAITAVVFGFCWLFSGLELVRHGGTMLTAHEFHAMVGFGLVAALIVCGLFYGPDAVPGKIDTISSIAIGVYLFAAALVAIASHHDPEALTVFTILTIATLAIAWRAEAAAAAVPAAALFAVFVVLRWVFDPDFTRMVAPSGTAGAAAPQPLYVGVDAHLALGGAYAALFAVMGFLAQGRSVSARVPILWSVSGVLTPILILVALYYRISNLERSIPFAFIALVLAAAFSWVTEQLSKRAPSPGTAASAALYATGAVAALCLAFTFALEKGWLTIGLALMVPGIAWIAEKRPLPMLRWLAAALVVLVVMRAGWGHIVGYDVGQTPIFNWLLYGYGVPAVAFWYAGYLLRRRADDHPARTVDAAAILFTVLLAVLEIRHLMNDGDVYGTNGGLSELATQVCVGLAMTIGLEHVRERTRSVIHNIGALVIAALTLFAIIFGLGIGVNPLFTGDAVGGPVFNLILLGYGLPAVLAIVLAMTTRNRRPVGYRICALVVAVALALAYLTLEVARFYHGPRLTVGSVTNAEQYTYSVVWLTFGVVLLIAGVFLRSTPARLASAAIVALTVVKVFLDVLSGLTGIFRALSFIGLGLVLVGIGLLYQRLLFPQRGTSVAAPIGAPPAT